ncbi:MAG: asparaginase, partial [Chloroflexota bacterium]
MTSSAYLPVFETTRGDTIESIHYGAIAVVNSDGELVASFGDPQTTTFTRSSAKPFQSLPFIEALGHEHFALSQEEIALICASHSGTDAHVAIAESIQGKVGIDKTQLLCGTHQPYDKAARKALLERGESPSVNHHDCSGKHSGMLAYAKMQSWPTESYIERDHPIQKAILKAVAEMSVLPEAQIKIGIDGCSAPNFAMPLYNAALAYA